MRSGRPRASFGLSWKPNLPAISDWSQVFSDSSEGANYRTIDRVLPKLDAQTALKRLYDPENPFVLVDPTEIERKQAKNTEYVGRLSDGKTLGFWTVVFAQPYRGRAIPFHFGVYSEATLNEQATSRNLQWRSLVWEIKELVGETPLIFDREFSAERWLKTLDEAGCRWVVRLNTKSGVKLKDEEGEEVPLLVGKGEREEIEGVYYRGEVKVNVAALCFGEKAKRNPYGSHGQPPRGGAGRGLRPKDEDRAVLQGHQEFAEHREGDEQGEGATRNHAGVGALSLCSGVDDRRGGAR